MLGIIFFSFEPTNKSKRISDALITINKLAFVKDKSTEQIKNFLASESKDFIQYKASLLAEEIKDEPLNKSNTVHDIVRSIANIPDRIKQELYLQSCSKLMNVSEDVLFSTLAQIQNKSKKNLPKNYSNTSEQLVKTKKINEVNSRFELEKNIIKLVKNIKTNTFILI